MQVSGRFLDDYWTNKPVTGTTNASGVVSWTNKGLCGVGAIAFLVENATLGTRRFDRTRGVLTNWVVPSSTPPSNQAAGRGVDGQLPARAGAQLHLQRHRLTRSGRHHRRLQVDQRSRRDDFNARDLHQDFLEIQDR